MEKKKYIINGKKNGKQCRKTFEAYTHYIAIDMAFEDGFECVTSYRYFNPISKKYMTEKVY